MATVNKAERDKIIAKIEAAAKKRRHMAQCLKGETNPQMAECYARSVGMADAFESVLEAFQGDPVSLGIWAD